MEKKKKAENNRSSVITPIGSRVHNLYTYIFDNAIVI